MKLDPERATWRQIAEAIRARILAAELTPGARVPTEVEITQAYGVSRVTARRALAALRAEGLVEVRGYRGTVVVDREPAETVGLSAGDEAVARMATPAERHEHGIGEGEPVIEVRRAGGTVELYGSRRVKLAARR